MGLTLSERQHRTIATALTILSAVVIAATVAGVFWLISAFFNRFANVLNGINSRRQRRNAANL